ncbi:MAG: GMC family oxidoreductase [Thermomicrobiaceae bacterium]
MDRSTTFDVVVAGGGAAGSALAGLLAGEHKLQVALIEAGPDYGSFESGDWPPELLNASRLPEDSHAWGYSGIAHSSQVDPTTFDRARVIGGCSSHNGCIALLGHYRDYDHWVNLGNPGWAFGSVRPSFLRAMERLRVRQPGDDEITPFQSLFMSGAVGSGIPQVSDLNHSGETQGVAAAPVNIADGVRWNAALAYLTDEVRSSGNLTVIDNAMVDRLVLEGDQATGLIVRRAGQEETIRVDRFVLSAGAYGSPGILERSGIGSPDLLAELGIEVHRELPGVGQSLTDHPAVRLTYRGSEELDREMSAQRAAGWCPDEQVLAKAASSYCDDAFDLHLYSVTGFSESTGSWQYEIYVSSVLPRSRGEVHIASADPEILPSIDHGFLNDADRRDLEVLTEGVWLARQIMQPALDSGMLAEEMTPGPSFGDKSDLHPYIEQNVGIYYHPSCSCRMGPSTDQQAVVDSLGRVYGLSNIWVCDASMFPTLMRANTNLPAVMVAEHLAPVIAAGR